MVHSRRGSVEATCRVARGQASYTGSAIPFGESRGEGRRDGGAGCDGERDHPVVDGGREPAVSAPVAVGELLDGQYRVERILGEGGMGVVAAARHVELGQWFAIKVLNLDASSVAAQRFLREARAVSRLEGDHVAKVFDVGQTDGGAPFMVMELLDGSDLDRLVNERGRLGPTEAVDYALQACLALDEAHRAGIVHRDIKPANLFRTRREDGSPIIKLIDFGVSKQEGSPSRTSPSLTATGAVLGSPHYMSPEQLMSSKDVDVRADIWSLGVTLYELLSGRTPFPGDGIANVFAAIMRDDPRPLRAHDPHIPAGLERVVGRCLDKSPDRRVPSVTVLARMLMPFASPKVAAEIQQALGIAPLRPPTPFEVGGAAPTPSLEDDDLMATVAYDPPARASSRPPAKTTDRMNALTVPIPSRGLEALAHTKAMTENIESIQIAPMPTPGLDTTVSDSSPPSDPLMVTIKEEPSFVSPSSRPAAKPERSALIYVAIGLFAAAVFVLLGVAVWYFVLRDDGRKAASVPIVETAATERSWRGVLVLPDIGEPASRLARVAWRPNALGHDGRAR
ncbi:MAG TPA: serine/threonine protein kinase [Polyangiaceae bacterium]|nr:serine/threonine protein kinase [Polyangiaceae bacterium]